MSLPATLPGSARRSENVLYGWQVHNGFLRYQQPQKKHTLHATGYQMLPIGMKDTAGKRSIDWKGPDVVVELNTQEAGVVELSGGGGE